MIGLFILHPKEAYQPVVHRDFGLILQEWAVLPNNTVPNTLAMEFNWLTINGKSGPATTPMLAKQGERIRLRFVNLGMDHHPMHLHGNQFVVTGTEGGRVPESAQYPGNTVLVGVAQARDVEFEAKYIGDWMVHCHLPHHMMNQMVSMIGPISPGAWNGFGDEHGKWHGMLQGGSALSKELDRLSAETSESAKGKGDEPQLVSHLNSPQGLASQHEIAEGASSDVMYPLDDLDQANSGYHGHVDEYGGVGPTSRNLWSPADLGSSHDGLMTLVRVHP